MRKPARGLGLALLLLLALVPETRSQRAPPAEVDPEVARLLERALHHAETLRKQFRTIEYDAEMRVQEWDAHGTLRGRAKATAVMRPGAEQPMTFVSREIDGKVRLPEPEKRRKRKRAEKEKTLLEFAEERQIAERFAFTVVGTETVAGQRASRVAFHPRPIGRRKDTTDRFLETISGTAWVSATTEKLVKFELRLDQPLQLFWIFAVLRELEIRYELLVPGEVLGRSKLQVKFALHTPVTSLRQQHDVQLDNFRRRSESNVFAALRPAEATH
ncbi:hypothetical protein BH20VER1_BH20VER1_15900 [soil metagenome]|jgi:hypothetical protein